ncbi:MAG TPA: molybdenum cofactor biosysynthesis protein [Verrucomicrobiae bacterium]|nr:molybdenum cofactor biosysynthesis protein [Verrucomicrobiae bacterium]
MNIEAIAAVESCDYHFTVTTPQIRIEKIFISPGHNFFGRHGKSAGGNPALEVSRVECIAGKGLVGDRFFNFKENYKGQVTFFSAEIFEDICRQFGLSEKSPGVTRRNIITRGVDLNSLIGNGFEIQGVGFLGISECAPCYWMDDAIAPGAEMALRGRGGLRAKILSDGILRAEA